MQADKILILGANGQIGTVLTAELRKKYGRDNVLATDIREAVEQTGPFVQLDVLDVYKMEKLIVEHGITQIYHLAAILSATGEQFPQKTWHVNVDAYLSMLEMVKSHPIKRIFFPSSIAVFGKTTPRAHTPQDVPLLPETVYGISKTTGENWSNYYHAKYSMDIRSIRYPGIIGWQSIPAGGTTDYAVEIYHAALRDGHYTCFLKADTRLPMMYMPDAIRATIELMEAPGEQLTVRAGYNLAGMSFTPAEITQSIQKYLPEFTISYEPDFRQDIAASWTESIDDSRARDDWHWKPEFDLDKMTRDMISHITPMYAS